MTNPNAIYNETFLLTFAQLSTSLFLRVKREQPWPWDAFHLTKKSKNFQTGANGKDRKTLVKFPENPEIVESFNRIIRKLREESHMEHKFPVRTFRKFRYTQQGCPLFQKFKEKLFHSSLEIPEIKQKFLTEWKVPQTLLCARI